MGTVSLLDAALESVADGILVVDGAHKVLKYNKNFVEMWRMPLSIIEPRNDDAGIAFIMDQLVDPDAFIEKVKRSYAAPMEEAFDILKLKDGRVFERYSRPVYIEGKVVGRVWSFRDVTLRNRSEEVLKEAHAILRGVVESPKDVVIFALDRGYRYIAFNRNHHRTMKRIWGVDIILGNSMLDYIKNSDDRRKAKENFDRALSGESFSLTEAYGDTELERRYYGDTYNPIVDEEGEVIGLTLFLTDITERKKLEAEREKLIDELKEALGRVKMLSGLLPVCSNCKRIRNEQGDWERIEAYIRDRSEADFSHSICPECARKIYPDFVQDE